MPANDCQMVFTTGALQGGAHKCVHAHKLTVLVPFPPGL